ncbi:O-antigen ligase domain-containing protein [Shewanella sp. D64]|uniref:O-antigen ligase domain-containing protein n=1 Tax=unclassified Shewanella TaxID=196818 RepID=UPI0022BA61E7|nr:MULTISPECIES: O-antigen ligase domain-containing protein [unclassified Shewanella]MEC4727763.1 O-antigen ligase domain-containing protein [Shewanella sp. D64]MEC4737526.1 O-antigen ligase domain-containing protein [Shewanella sp. E94]WBJ97335.1 O-antigen ligase domain-containing protein [Shewanella sp. MTB7]
MSCGNFKADTSLMNSDEKLIWYSITYTYVFWLLGALYIVGPVVGWVLFLRMTRRFIYDKENYITSTAQFDWIAGMLIMLIALVIAHFEYELGIAKLIKSSIGWAKGWALFAIFPLIGSLNIRPELIYRASCIVCKHTLIILPFCILAWLVGLPSTLYVSPLSIIGGPGPEFFSVSLYEIDPGSGTPRWRLFTPWAPALGMMGNLFFNFAIQEKTTRYKVYGLLGSLVMVLISQSRLAIACYIFLLCYFTFIRWHKSPLLYFLASPTVLILGLLGTHVTEKIEMIIAAIKSARAGSTRVREHLSQIALDRWANEALVWGHGIVERGPHLVEYMHIGSHHTWYGLLFVKGLAGALALAIPLIFSLITFSREMFKSIIAASSVALLLQLCIYTLGENLEILVYLFWPGLIIIGIAHKRKGA